MLELTTYITSCNDLGFTVPDQAQEWQQLSAEADHCGRWLIRRAWIYYGNAAIMCSKGQSIAARRESTAMHPSCRIIYVFAADCIERQALAPHAAFRPFIDAFDEARKHPCMCIC